MTANLQLRAKDDKGQERILLKAHHVPWILGPFHVFIEDSQGSNTFTQIGELEEIGKSNGRYRADTVLGEALPFGVDFVSELSGRNLQVRDDGGVVFIEATIPAVQ